MARPPSASGSSRSRRARAAFRARRREKGGAPPPRKEARKARVAPVRRAVTPAARRKSLLVLGVSLFAFLVPAALFAGADLSGWIYPPPPAPVPLVAPGDTVALALEGRLDGGVPFLLNTTLNATIGGGSLVPGLDAALIGLAAGDAFNVTLAPEDAYGPWNASRLVHIQTTEDNNRVIQVSSSAFQNRWGAPMVGESVATQPWTSTVTAVAGGLVTLRYEPTLNQSVSLYRYWISTVLSFNTTTIRTSNDLYLGDSFEILSQSSGKVIDVRVTGENVTAFTLDLNPALAGQTLHYRGQVLSIVEGSSVSKTAGGAVSLGPDSCERCHVGAGFDAIEATAAATRAGSGIVVKVTVSDPWQHDLAQVRATASTGSASAPSGGGAAELSGLSPGAHASASLTIAASANVTQVTVVVDATAHHVHASGGKPTDLPYQLTLKVPVGGQSRALAAPPPAPPAVDLWVLVGRLTGFAALGVACLSAVQGFRRHLKRAPKIKWPPWLTLHFSMSLFAIVLTLIHAVALMSTTYRAVWTWDITVGVVSLLALGTMGVTGVVLAKWTPARWPGIRKWHYWLMVGMLITGFLHTLVSGTTLRMLLGW